INVELIEVVVTATWKSHKRVRRARGRKCVSVEVRRQIGIYTPSAGSGRRDECRGLSRQHLGAIEGERLRTQIRGPRRVEHVHAHVVRVGPDAELRVVVEARTEMEVVAVIRAGRVRGSRNGYAFVG